jgi:hypothetical protein
MTSNARWSVRASALGTLLSLIAVSVVTHAGSSNPVPGSSSSPSSSAAPAASTSTGPSGSAGAYLEALVQKLNAAPGNTASICQSVVSTPSGAVLLYELAGHVQGVGDVTAKRQEWLGTKGQGRRLEAVGVKPQTVAGNAESWPFFLKLMVQVSYPGTGLSGWVEAPSLAGTKGLGRALNGVAFKIAGPCTRDYTVEYSCHISDLGDQPVAADGTLCGTNANRQLEAVTVTVRRKPKAGVSTPGKSNVAFGVINAAWAAKVNGQFILQDTVIAPDTWLGTKGQGNQLSLFGVKPDASSKVNPWPSCLQIRYMAHVSNVGDTPWYDAPQVVTGGVEGVAFKLVGACASQYTAEYQCHLQGYGDVPMISDGALCGTRRQGRRLEALKLTVRKK